MGGHEAGHCQHSQYNNATHTALSKKRQIKNPRLGICTRLQWWWHPLWCHEWNDTFNSGRQRATSNIGTENDPCTRTGAASNTIFILPGGQALLSAPEIATFPFNRCVPASDVHITQGFMSNSLLSTIELADANYIPVVVKQQVNVYNVNVLVMRGAILHEWRS